MRRLPFDAGGWDDYLIWILHKHLRSAHGPWACRCAVAFSLAAGVGGRLRCWRAVEKAPWVGGVGLFGRKMRPDPSSERDR